MKMWLIRYSLYSIFYVVFNHLISTQGQTLHNSGTRSENSYYGITNCNSGTYYIYIHSAWYGHSNWCSDSDALSNVRSWCHGKSYCAFYFSNGWFGDPCGGYSKSGWVKWYCARNGGWSVWSTWTTCSLMCGSGSKTRSRSCNNPTQVSPGSACSGSTSDSTSCNTGACPTNQLLSDHRGPWRLVFKSPNYVQASGYSDIYSFYAASGNLNNNDVDAMTDFSASSKLYKSDILDNWASTVSISAVRLSGYKSGAEQVYIIFNGFGKSKLTWMDCNNGVIDGTWTDVASETKNYCDMAGTGTLKRNFYINRAYGGCTVDTGWFMLKDYGSNSGCNEFDSTSSTAPFVRYATSSTYANWASSTTVGDSMAIFVLEWHMVFKGVQGVTSSAGYLEALWEGSSTENDDDLTTKTLTKSPSKTYKSKIVEDWSSGFIEQVKYAFFTSGVEKAWVVFDGRSTTKNTWFTDSKVLYSRYTDLTTSMTSDSISGDGVRAFALIRSTGSCSAYTAWMFSLDNPSGSQPCSWDKNVQTRPYFLYSSGTTYVYCQSGSNWNSGSFPAAETMGIFIKGWYPVMKFAQGQSLSPASSVYNLWTGTYTLNDHDSDGQSFATSTKCYKSAIVDSWSSYYIKAVRVSWIVSGVEKAYIVFDAHGSDKNSWFNCDRILYTSYNDINRDTSVVYCSVVGQSSNERRFYLQGVSSSCDQDAGWFAVVEDSSPSCSSWESKTSKPYPMYSDASGYELNTNMAVANVFAISVDMDNYCSTISCLNGATCYERGVKFECVCAGAYYGTFCADRDGVWTDWTAWTTCSTTCYAQGTVTRTRTCTNPSQAGSGIVCPGDSSETLTCIPDLRICSSYNTGTVAENTQYTMVCPTGYHIVVHSAFYGLSSAGCSSSVAVYNLRTHCSAKTTCTFAFSDTYFTDPCNSYTKQGYATMYCRLDVQLTQPRGPWRLVFKAPASTVPTGFTDLYDLFSSSSSFNDDYNHAAMRDFSANTDIYKSLILEDWGTTRTISAVRVSVMDNGGEAHYVIFNGFGKTKMTYWDCDDILESSWIDMKTEPHNMCTMVMNTGGYKRNFFINRAYDNCHSDTGWLFVKDFGATDACSQYDLTSNTPYIMYSTGDTYVTFANNKQYADSLAIFVLEWHMVFKGIEGLVPTAGSLEDSWEGTTTENDDEDSVNITLTTAQNKCYKSANVEYWSNILIDQVKYAYFTNGTEVANVVFDGRGTTKNTWFASTKILYSVYTDITTESKSTASISGDGTRQFALIRNSGACSAYNAWMMALDNPSGAQTCSWDKNVKSRPYFLYSSGTNYSAPELSSAWNSAGFPAADVLGVFIKGWLPVFKWARGQSVSPASSVYDLWSGTYTLNEFEDDSFSFAANSLSYKSSIVDKWSSSYYFSSVRASFYESGIERAYVVFDAHGSTKTTWMSVDRILYSSYKDLQRHISPTSFGVAGYTTFQRRFLAQYYFHNCDGSVGWFGVMERTSGGCAFESKTTRPYPMYSDAGQAENNDNQVVADVFAVSVAFEDYLPCSSSPCQNSYGCFNRGPRFVCNCTGTYYGMICDRRDGAWADWSAWSVCTTTCYAYGTQTRTRTCTNPTKVGVGIDCPSVSSETVTCLPEFNICPEYNTGTIAEGGTYTMICPTNMYIIVDSAFYGNSGASCSDADATYNLRSLCHRKSSCSITFNDALFGDPCSSYSKTATATMKCAENLLLTQHRGPWRIAFKVPSGVQPVGYTDVWDFYQADGSMNDNDIDVMRDFSSGGKYYKSSLLDDWGTNVSISAVRYSAYKSGKEVAYIIYDAKGKNKTNWMDCENVLDSSFIDITYENQTICDFSDATTYKRNFFISKSEVDCTSAEGWLFLKDYGATSGCTNWDATSVTMPYIVYSTDSTFTTWETGNKAYADALVISVLEWDMIFKGVEGVVPSTSSLKSLWEGSDTSNDLDTSVATVTQAPHQVYKSKILEDWQNVIKDMVKFAFFNDGQEVASVVFDGRGTTKTSWFADSKILYSSFDDLTVGSTATCSIAGDGIRAFAIIKTSGACSAHEAWMLVMDDASASKPCSWDKNVRSRPYYLYSASQSASNCETGGSWVSSSFPFAENMAIFMKAWYPVFKFAHGQSISPATSIYDLWTGSYTLNDHDYDGFSFASNTETYKSNIVGNWPKFYVNSVRAAFYTNGIEKAFVVFDAHGSDQNSWFDCSRILYTSWDDLSRDITPAYCSIAGHTSYNRRFYLNYETQSCTNAHGWFGIMEHSSASCSWESKTTRPFAVYSDHTGYELNNNMAVADVFAVSIALDALDSYCDIVTCEHNGTCYNRHGFFECVCNETFYGMVCQTRDGNWTEWSAWATCSTTCWALGSHSRTRTCTNPSPIGSKAIDCSGIDGGHDTETKECIPDLPVCPLYSTGTIATTASPNTYRMVCPTTHYTAAISASFGHSTCSDSSATHDLRWYCDGKINCTIPFSNTVFGNNCYQSSSSGSATLKCVEHTKLTEHRGPWRLVLKAPSRTQATGFSDIASFFEDDGALNDDSISDMVDFSSNGNLYKSSLLPEWGTNLSVSAVRFSIIKSNVEVGYVVFDAKGKNKTDWFDCNNILDSSWVDIVKDTKVYCDLHATGNFKRHFYIGKNDSDCDTASGWFFLKDYGATEDCSGWDKISSNLPSIIYSADNMAVTWSTGNTQTADALALYIMEWRMVFKGIEGEVPSSASSLENLWKGSTQENDNDKSFVTLTTTPSKPFKSLTVDQWTQYNIEMELNSGSFIKSYPYQMDSERTTVQFLKKAGYEVASVVFDGRGTSKNEWFDASKILYSSYEDVASLSSAVSSISGDGVRAFALIQQSSGTCSLIKAWMMAIDKASGPQTCSWDKNIRTRPYFLYSSNSTWSYPDTAGSWSEANFPTAETMGIFIKGWFPIMKAAHGESLLPATGIYNLWTGSHGGINEFEYDAFSFNSSSRTLRSSIIDNWQNHYLPAVRVSLIVGGVEKAFVVFDAHGTDKNNWFNCDRILYTSYGDLNRIIQPQYCSIAGESGALRYFFLAYYINTCSNSYGWFGISERTSGCNWDYFTSAPYAFYSDHTGYELLSNTAVADVFAISVALDDYCVSAPCQNNATCYDRGTQFECICNGTFYGMVCEHRDGNWTEWSAWATCSTTCWALGSHSRTRTCTNPFPVGTKGIDCSGIDGGHSSETKLCIPNLPVCPEYNTGNIFETSSPNSYSMVCPLTHFTMVISAFYGHGSCSDSNALKDLRWLCDGKINCTISFTDSTFGDPCPSPSNYGNAVLKCVQHMKLTQHRGPWQLVFKVPSGVQATGYDDIMSFYAASGSLNEGSVAVMTDFSSGGSLFKSPFLDEWGINRTVSAVKAGVHKGNKEVGYIVFDAMGKGKMDWMDCSRILYSSWLDVHMESTDFCGINNTGNYKRNFFVSKNETDCTSAKGWLLLKDYGATSGCSSWDSTSSPTMPYILYSKDEMAVQWSNGNKDFADALAISVMDWDMVFKGVQGVVPAAGSLKALWEGSDTENENEEDFKTITKYPGKTFKSTIVQQWEKLNIETMKYSFFNDGSEVAWVVFDGRSTTKNTVFDGTNVLYSRYLDMPSLSKAVSSISGDGVRTFELAHQTGSCSNFKAWMMIIDDPSGAQTCSWDKNIQTRPYFMYSSNYTWSYPEEAGSWNSASFPVAETMGIFINGWFPVMKYAHGQSYGATGVTSILDMWTGNYIINEFDYEALNYNTSSKSYKSSLVDTWSDHLVKAVKISFEAGGQEKAFAVFDGYGTNKNSWFDCSRLLYTSYDNLNRWISPEFCGITGDTANKRHFFAQYDLSDCSNSYGWFGMIERTNTGCSWETKTTRPYALYSDHTGYELNTNMAVAEVFAISVALDNYCDSSPCKNNATCYNRETTFECICNGTFYGMDCAHRDGNWSVWAAWGECSVSCYSIGTHVRTRSCSDPTPVGDGLLCQGNDVWQIKECIPILQVCPSYDSGNITEGNSFRMVCPSTHFILVDSGWYGNDTVGGVTITYSYQTSYMYYWKVGNDTFSQVRYNTNYYDVFYNCIDEDAVHDLRAYCHKKINCTVEFGEALFKEDPCPTKLKTGNVQMRCVEHNQLTEFRGPWRVVFKVSSGTTVPGYNDMASLYLSSDSYNDLKDTAMNDFSSGSEAFMSSSLGEWNTKRSINAVRLSVFKNNEEVGFVVFDAWNKTKTTWFDCNNILDSSWGDLLLKKATFCGFQGEDTNVTRNFFISKIDGTCDLDSGWVVVKDFGAKSGCSWDSTTAKTMPYIMYSPNNYYVNWSSADAQYADSLAISVLEWNMVFKGVQGVTSAQGSLSSLWDGYLIFENEDDPTAKTVTKAPNKVVKEKILEDWDDWVFLELAKYSFFNSGQEVAYIIFDTRGDMTKDAFFSDSKIVFSSYEDINSYTKSNIGVDGDGVRKFLVAKDTSSCANFNAWMFVLDEAGGSKPCSFDNNVVTRPYFLYSNNRTIFPPQSGSSWDSDNFPVAEVMAIFLKGWFPVMRVTMGQPLGNATSILDLWMGEHIINEWDYDAVKYTSSKTHKSSIVDNWNKFYISGVRVSYMKGSVEKAYVVFDAHGSNKSSWFDCRRILYTNYNDLSREIKAAYCGITGDTDTGKHFFIEYAYNNCSDYGWFGLIENTTDNCGYVGKSSTPFGLFSDAPGYEQNNDMEIADKFQIAVALRGYCESNPCQNGATCYDRVGRFECVCAGTFYGMTCLHRDGNWTEWTPWDTCTTTCYAVGTQERYRNCTNPTTEGDGIYCANEDWQIQDCIPAFPICAEYNTGDMNSTYQMVCPWDHYIYVDSAWWGAKSNGTTLCSDSDATTDLKNLCHSTINCTFTFSAALFSQPCTGHSPYGYAKMYCARDGQWTNWEAWTWCPVTCAGGLRTRDRYCTNPTTVPPGQYCPDVDFQQKACLTDPCPICGNHRSGYDDPTNISVFQDTTSGVGYLMLDVNWEIHCCEVISAFEFVPQTDGDIDFLIWRKVNSHSYKVINALNYTVNGSEVGTVVNITLPLKQRLAAAKYDVIGWYTLGQNMINYAPCQGELCPTKARRLVMSKPSVGDTVKWIGTSTRHQNRAYAIRFYTHPNESPFLNQTIISVLAKDSSPIGTSIIDYNIQDDDIGDPLTHTFTHELFELNTTFEYLGLMHFQTTGPLPSKYKAFQLIAYTWDTCHHTSTTTLEVITYNAPPVFHNLPNRIELTEATISEVKLFDVDVKDYSDNDSVCCTLAQVIPGSLNFHIKFINETYSLWTMESPVFDYSGISNYYKLWVCCSDQWGVTANFLEIDIVNVIEKVEYIPPTWFLTAIGASMVPIILTFLMACAVMCPTFFCDAEIEYYYD